MRTRNVAVLLFCVIVDTLAVAQTPTTPVFGSGTTNFIPKFLTPNKIGNSRLFQSPSGNIGLGTTAPIYPLHLFSSNVTPPAGQCCAITAFVESTGSADGTAVIALEGLASAGSGVVQGVNGTTFSPGGIGVFGSNNASASGGGGGVLGITNSADFGFSYGTRGTASANTGSAVAFFGETFSVDGTAGYFLNRAGGNIIVGHVGQNDDQSVFRVDGTGKVFADGGFQPYGADFAEAMTVNGDPNTYAAGDLLVIDTAAKRSLNLAQQPYSTRVAGIYSTKPGMLGSTHRMGDAAPQNEVPLAVVGIVPCKVTAENGPIEAGDLLVTSSTAGRAMKGTDRARMLGAVVGKALEPLQSGQGVIQVLVTLQ